MSKSRPTIFDVAGKAGVSKSLVSLALSGSPKVSETSKQIIMKAAAELGYRPNAAARSLAAKRTKKLGVLILDIHNPVFAEILDGVQSEVRKQGFSTMLISGAADSALEQKEINNLLEFQVEGLILISHRLSENVLRSFARDVPTVVVTRGDIEGSNLDTVSNDDIAGAEMAVDHLVSLGHKKIVHLNLGDNPVSKLRADGYRLAMARHGLSEYARVIQGGMTDAAGYMAAVEALKDSPTAIFAANDVAAIGAMAAVENSGLRIPEDVSVIGYDGISIGGMRRLNLTTVAQPLEALGSTAAKLLLERIATPNKLSVNAHLTAKLEIRGTTARPPAELN